MTGRDDAREVLEMIGETPDDQIDLAEGALALAALERPHVDLQRYRDHLRGLAGDVGELLESGVAPQAALQTVIYAEQAYQGDSLTYDDLQNANLMRVIDRRKGLPVALGILCLHAIRQGGGAAAGLNFPGHFLIRLEAGDERVIVDPFDSAAERTTLELRRLLKATRGLEAELAPENYRTAGNRDILVRLQNNIRTRHENAGRLEDALRQLEWMSLVAPDEIYLVRNTAFLHARLGNLSAAIRQFERVVENTGNEAHRLEAAAALQKLRTRLN